MTLVLVAMAVIWGGGALTGAPHSARWLGIGLVYFAVLILHGVLPDGHALRAATGGSAAPWGVLGGIAALLARLPDCIPPGVEDMLRHKASVVPVPIDTVPARESGKTWFQGSPGGPLRLLWAGRFEYDKGGDRLLLLLEALEQRALDYQLALVGQQFRQVPAVFGEIEERFAHRIVHSGYLPNRDDYRALLAQSDIVISTALHEFQGLAVLEAVARGCLPLLPARQVYPELVEEPFLYPSLEDAPEQEAAGAVAALESLAERLARGDHERPSVEAFAGDTLAARYREQLSALCRGDACSDCPG